MFGKFGEAAVRFGHKIAYRAKLHSPAILLGAGAVNIVTGVVLCCKATLKVEDILDEAEADRAKIERAKVEKPDEYTDSDAAKDGVTIRVRTIGKLIVNYAPGCGMIFLGMSCFMGSYGIMRKRNIALLGAYNALSEEFARYRTRVLNENGPAFERAIFSSENKEGGDNVGENDGFARMRSPYVKCFCPDTTVEWTRNATANYSFLKQQERYCNEVLRARGHLFLNEVYDLLGFNRDEAGALCGWMYDPNDDHKISFGINDEQSIAYISPRNFSEEAQNEFLLEFNVDGIICDKI